MRERARNQQSARGSIGRARSVALSMANLFGIGGSPRKRCLLRASNEAYVPYSDSWGVGSSILEVLRKRSNRAEWGDKLRVIKD